MVLISLLCAIPFILVAIVILCRKHQFGDYVEVYKNEGDELIYWLENIIIIMQLVKFLNSTEKMFFFKDIKILCDMLLLTICILFCKNIVISIN